MAWDWKSKADHLLQSRDANPQITGSQRSVTIPKSAVYNQKIENRGTPSAMHRQIGNREFPGVRANAKWKFVATVQSERRLTWSIVVANHWNELNAYACNGSYSSASKARGFVHCLHTGGAIGVPVSFEYSLIHTIKYYQFIVYCVSNHA